MEIGKIITIDDISIEIILSSNELNIGDILEVKGNSKYIFEVVETTYLRLVLAYIAQEAFKKVASLPKKVMALILNIPIRYLEEYLTLMVM